MNKENVNFDDNEFIDLELLEEEIPVEYKDEPLQLINFEGSKFVLNEEAMNIIKSINDEVIIVAVVGKARTGKSYLMNLLLDNVGTDNKSVLLYLFFYTNF